MILYSYYRSSCSYRVRIGLNLKGLQYEVRPIHLMRDGGEQFQDEFTARNPSQKVPVLLDGEKTLFQSVAILEYLDDTFAEAPLYPRKPIEKAHMRMMCELINSDIQPLQNLRVLKKLKSDYGFNDEQKVSWIQHWIQDGFRAYEKLLEENSNQPFSWGDRPTAADCFLIPQVYNAVRFDVDMKRFPRILRVFNHCTTLSAFKRAHPDNQIDTPHETP